MKLRDPIAQFVFIIFLMITALILKPNTPLERRDILLSNYFVPSGTLAELAFRGRLSLQHATQEALEELPGVGPIMARRIIQWRKQNGQDVNVQNLNEIRRIGTKTMGKLELYVY